MVTGCPWDARDQVCGISVDARECRTVHAIEEVPCEPSPGSVVKDDGVSPRAVACLRRVRERVAVGYRPRRRATSNVRLARVFAVRAWSSRECSCRTCRCVRCRSVANRRASRDRGRALPVPTTTTRVSSSPRRTFGQVFDVDANNTAAHNRRGARLPQAALGSELRMQAVPHLHVE